jgi:hypothetical protein
LPGAEPSNQRATRSSAAAGGGVAPLLSRISIALISGFSTTCAKSMSTVPSLSTWNAFIVPVRCPTSAEMS